MTKRIAIIQGHPDAAGHHLLNAMADAYAEAAVVAFTTSRAHSAFEFQPPDLQ